VLKSISWVKDFNCKSGYDDAMEIPGFSNQEDIEAALLSCAPGICFIFNDILK